jgi:flagellar biosynthesis/type III secretory pathway chaperone
MSDSGLVGGLIENIKNQEFLYRELTELSEEKKNAVVKNDVAGLKNVTSKETLLTGKAQKLERLRFELMQDIALVLNKKPEVMTVSYLTELLGDKPEAGELKEAAKSLIETLDKLSEINDLNKVLLQNALEYVDFSINVIRSTAGNQPSFSSPYGNISSGNGLFDVRHDHK